MQEDTKKPVIVFSNWTKMRLSVLFVITLVVAAGLVVATAQVSTGNVAQQNGNDAAHDPAHFQSQSDRDKGKVKPKRDIKLTITPVVYSETVFEMVPTEQYKFGKTMTVKVEMTNLMAEETEVVFGDTYTQNRVRLLKDGKPVFYRREVQKAIRRAEEARYPGFSSRYPILLKPNETKAIGGIALNVWFEPLEVGRYELTMQHRFWAKEQPVESNTITFEVVP